MSNIAGEHALATYNKPDLLTWHRRLGHANYQAISDMTKSGLIQGVNVHSLANIPKCDACIIGKQTRSPVPKVRRNGEGGRATRRLEKVWVDLTGPMDIKSRTGNLYIMNIVDDYSSFPWSILLKNKSKAFSYLQTWQCA